jgi:hypothetical protein
MELIQKFPKGVEVAPGFTVIQAYTRPVIATKENPITQFVEVKLDPLYENLAILAFATFMEKPASNQWLQLALTGRENVRQLWKPKTIGQECLGVDYTRRVEAGHLAAVSQLVSWKNNMLISAQLLWFGLPFINQFFVGFKPGMRERTEELLQAGLKLA